MPEPRLVLNMAACKRCGTVIISASVHDFRSCRCGAVHVDGGLDYLKRGGHLKDIIELSVRSELDGRFSFVQEPLELFGEPDVAHWFKHADGPWHAVDLEHLDENNRDLRFPVGGGGLMARCGAIIYSENLPPHCELSKRVYAPGRVCKNCLRSLPDPYRALDDDADSDSS